MDAEKTILKIQEIEELGKKKIEQAEKEKEDLLKKARQKALSLIEQFDEGRDSSTQEKIRNSEADIRKEVEKIVSKAERGVDDIKKKASLKTWEASEYLFEEFKKEVSNR